MPLQTGKSPDVIGANIAELIRAGHSPAQAAAIAYHTAADSATAAGIMYCTQDQRVLLLRRSAGAEDEPLAWCFPGGGRELGETAEDAARRESTEEVGYTPDGDLSALDNSGVFATFRCDVPEPFDVVLNDEHDAYMWVRLTELPTPMHPGVAATLARLPSPEPVATMDARVYDINGWFEVPDNPISKAGVFPYSGRQLGKTGPEADKIFRVLRPPEELADPECIESFKLLPWIDDHTMLGPAAQELSPAAQPAEKKGVAGVIGEKVYFKEGKLYANIKAFSDTLAQLIAAGKRELSAGYRCIYEMASGVWEGQPYDAVQRKIRGNHLALVGEGRMGPDVAVMDRFTFSFDASEITMDPTTEQPEGGAQQMTIADAISAIKTLVPLITQLTEVMAPLLAAAEKTEVAATGGEDPAVDGEPAKPEGEAEQPAQPAPTKPGMTSEDASERAILSRIAKRDALARQLSAHVGTFDHAEMTLSDVVAYGCDKLGLKPAAGAEQATVEGWLSGRGATHPPATVVTQDSKTETPKGGAVDRYLTQE